MYVQALQRRAHAPRIKDCKRFNLVIIHVERHKCGFQLVILRHPLRLIGRTDAAFTAQFGEPTGLALRGAAAALIEHDCPSKPVSSIGKAKLVNFIVRRKRRAARSTFSAELDELVDSIEQMMLLQVILHQIYCGTGHSPSDTRSLSRIDRYVHKLTFWIPISIQVLDGITLESAIESYNTVGHWQSVFSKVACRISRSVAINQRLDNVTLPRAACKSISFGLSSTRIWNMRFAQWLTEFDIWISFHSDSGEHDSHSWWLPS